MREGGGGRGEGKQAWRPEHGPSIMTQGAGVGQDNTGGTPVGVDPGGLACPYSRVQSPHADST